ncbi:MAG: sensor histidine kinase [Lachnospiraceae bacterium]|nr:sensor histidine kinase [Lachnospiraceae bacterium]MBR4604826.1 sensor histidine kinase [Lachnospiraceae bacterium]MBR6152624.1 sensor histidine kinase [Lachnospiraceae bacterium]
MNGQVKNEKSILGQINDLSHRLVLMLVFPIIISLVLMLFYAWKYHSSIVRMETITNLKKVVAEEIPGSAWNIVSGQDTVQSSGIYAKIHEVNDTIEMITEKTGQENRLSLIVASRTMETLENYVDHIRDNIEEQVPVVKNEEVLVEVRDVAALVDSMLNEYIAQEITSTASMSMSLGVVIIVTAIAEILIVVAAWLVRNKAVKSTAQFVRQPIERLEVVAAQLAEGTLDARLTDTEVTELRNLTMQVNTMANRLEEMMEKSNQDARKLRKAELRTLQAQINPHFLYNTLDAIVWKAEAGEKDEVIQLTSALSDFFRISLSSGADWIPISQEKKHIEGYLKIQQTRYRDIMRYEIDIPDEIGHLYILKLLLQPLVENALYHGIKIKRGGGTIKVSGRMEDGYLIFGVKDTGLGMTKEQLEDLNERMKKGQPVVKEDGGGFGLVNVNMRIRLYYNQQDGLNIASNADGTEVSFRVPCRTREEIFEHESVSGG